MDITEGLDNDEQVEHVEQSKNETHPPLPNEYTEIYRRLSIKRQLSYGIGHVLNDVCASMWFTYLLVYFHLVLQFDNKQTGIILLVGQIADALSTPFVGYHSDQSGAFACKYGKRKTWHLIGSVCVVLTFPFIFSPCVRCANNHDWAEMFYYSMFVIIFQFGWAAVQISHLSLIPELTPNDNDRTKLTAVRYSFTVASNLLVYIITWIVLRLNRESGKIGPDDGVKFQHIIYSILAVGVVSTITFHIYTKEDNTSDITVNNRQLSVLDLFKKLNLYRIALVYMSSRLFVNLSQVFIPLYLHETLSMDASALASIPLVMFSGSFGASLCVERVNRYLKRKLTYALGACAGLCAVILIKYGESAEYKHVYIYVVAVLLGASGSAVLVTSLGVTTDFIGRDTANGAFVYGLMSFTDKLANGVAVVVIQYLHTSEASYYRDVLTNVCGGAVVLGVVVLAGCDCLTARRGDGGGGAEGRGRRRGSLVYERVPDYNSIN